MHSTHQTPFVNGLLWIIAIEMFWCELFADTSDLPSEIIKPGLFSWGQSQPLTFGVGDIRILE